MGNNESKKGMKPAEMSEETWLLFFTENEELRQDFKSDGRRPTGFFGKAGALEIGDENMLVRMAQSGDRIAFGALYEMHREKVYKHLWYMVSNREDALDLTTDTFIKAMDAVESFRGDSSFLTWLFAIASRTAIDFLRKRRIKTLPLSLFHSLKAKDEDIHEQMDERRKLDAIMKSLNVLSPKEKAVFVLRYVEDRSVSQTGDILDIAEGTVKALYHRAIKKLKNRLGGV